MEALAAIVNECIHQFNHDTKTQLIVLVMLKSSLSLAKSTNR